MSAGTTEWSLDSCGGGAGLCVAAVLALFTLYTDGRRREIPHWLVLALALIWLPVAWLAPAALAASPWAALGCGIAGLAVGFALHALGWLGGGDGKLLAVLALWLGPRDLGPWLLAAALLGLLLITPALIGRGAGFRSRGIPFAWALAPPAAALLLARAAALSS